MRQVLIKGLPSASAQVGQYLYSGGVQPHIKGPVTFPGIGSISIHDKSFYSIFKYHSQGPPSSTTFGFIDVPGYIIQVLNKGFPSAKTQVGQYLYSGGVQPHIKGPVTFPGIGSTPFYL